MNNRSTPKGIFESRHSNSNIKAYELAEKAFNTASIPLIDKLEAFPRFVTKRSIARFMVREKLFEKILNINGIIVECGVLNGAGLFTWAQLTNIYEPVNYNRRIIGFDTFEGFPSISDVDNSGIQISQKGDLCGSSLNEIELSIEKHNKERHLAHIPNIELVQGDFTKTASQFLKTNPHTLVSLLYLDFDLYEPTRKALEVFLPHMPKGAIIAFDEINCPSFPGETQALQEVMGIRNHKIERFSYDPWISYIVLS